MPSLTSQQKETFDKQALDNFREYLRIATVHPNINYDKCVAFLESQAKSLNLPVKVIEVVPKKPIVIITWVGTQPNLPSILLNSHTDVVPVFEDKWTQKPFGADIVDGKIYARGTQDMKSVGTQYIETIRRLKSQGVKLKRTIHICFVPDEEIGGILGMKEFIKTKEFRDLNVGLSLDEGMSSVSEEYMLAYAERCIWHLHIHCPGSPGHGSLLLKDTAGHKVNYILNKFFEFRKGEEQKLIDNPSWSLGDVTTVNLTQLKGGVQSNVVPPELTIVIDCRIPTTVNIKEWEATVNKWCQEAGPGVYIEYEQKQPQVAATKLDNSNPFWTAFKAATDSLGLKLKLQSFPGGTDSRYLRELGIPALGFTPINNTPVLLHDNDEFIRVDTFLKGIEIYSILIPAVANVE